MLKKEQVAEIVAKFGTHEGDTGSSRVQVALLTEQIKALTEHLKKNRHDYSSQRGLQILVGKRRSLLSYIKKNDVEEYAQLIKDLGLRK